MSSRRFKKERHPFANPSSHAGQQPSLESLDSSISSKGQRKHVSNDHHANDEFRSADLDDSWTPTLSTATKLLLSARLCSVVWSYITDCDETYNYWEPLHYLLYKSGFQTWEYSPIYAIRSYAYLILHALPLKLYEFIFPTHRFIMFYLLRMFLGVVSVLVDRAFYSVVQRTFGPSVSRIFLVFLILAPGFFISSTAFLPSSLAMLMTSAAFTAWFSGKTSLSIFFVATSAIVGWPFAGILGAPIAFDLIQRQGLVPFASKASKIGGVISCLVILIDSTCYGKLVFPTLNIVLYNVISGHGPELYGVEPWYFYVFNGFLNFNIAFLLALISPVLFAVLVLSPKKQQATVFDSSAKKFALGSLAAVLIWFAIFFKSPHKEERFLFPVYGLLSLLAALAFHVAVSLPKISLRNIVSKATLEKSTNILIGLLIVIFAVLSLSRTFALTRYYSGSMEIYRDLQLEAGNLTSKLSKKETNLCVGKEWHRYPSSFWLPDRWHLQFIRSEFHGLLPKPYEKFPRGMSVIPTEMNDGNREEPTRYVDVCQCNYLIDLEYEGGETQLEPHYSNDKKSWSVVFEERFLDSANSHKLFRAFYVPWISEKYVTFGRYLLLKRISSC